MRRARRTALTAQTGLRTTGSSGHSRTLESAYLALRHTLLDGPGPAPGRPARHRAGTMGPAHPLPAPPPPGRTSNRHRRTSTRIGPQPPTRRQLITAIITSQPPERLERPRTRGPAPRQAAQHAHPGRRMGQARVLHPQHAATRHVLDICTRPLTTRHCVASRRSLTRQQLIGDLRLRERRTSAVIPLRRTAPMLPASTRRALPRCGLS